MPQILLNSLDVISGLDAGNSIGMSQIVESGFIISKTSHHGLEVLVDGVHT